MTYNNIPRSLSIQIVAGFIAIVILTAVTVGIPAILIMERQLDQQAWSQVEQGQRAAISLYAAKHQEVRNLSLLITQQPTLHNLLIQDDIPALKEYLESLRASVGLTRIMICSPDEELLATTDEAIPEYICSSWKTGTYQYNPFGNAARACLTSFQPIESDNRVLGDVFVCQQLNSDFATQMREKTGLEHTIWIGDLPVSTSYASGIEAVGNASRQVVKMEGFTSHHTFEIDGTPYYSAQIPLEEAGLKAEVALDISSTITIQKRVAEWIISAILVISILGTLFSILISKRLSLVEKPN